ncbi:MAG: TIGR00159 family protein [Eubacterium sp.]|jgi:TIGR00159 family protein|nr:TIGR00159 family protein [Eubacterium sp.]
MDTIISFFRNYVAWLTIPEFTITDVLEIVIIAYAFYHIILWIKDTRAWMLLKGMILLGLIFLAAVILEMNVVLWVFRNAMVVGIMALIVIFQPELRGALEQLGRKNILSSLASFDNQRSKNERYTEKSIQAIVKATYDMAKVKTGALIVVEKEIQCREYERTGIPIDSEISSQLIINIFEHNTPLHDGAVLVRDNRIVAATCYLPLSNNLQVSKELGTRHRAGLGISEVSDSLTIIVSEETGFVSLACDGRLYRKIDADTLQLRLFEASRRSPDDKKKKWWKGRRRHEKQDNN